MSSDDSQGNRRSADGNAVPTPDEAAGRQSVGADAGADDREHVGELYWGLLATSVVLWLSVQVGLMFALPDRVPLHWSDRTQADSWTSRFGAFVALWVPLIIPAVLPLCSRIVMHRPVKGMIRARSFWAGSPANLRRFERLLREDLILVSVMYMVVLAWLSFTVGLAAKDENGAIPQAMFTVPTILFVLGVCAVISQGIWGKRYDPEQHFDLEAPEE